MIQWSQLGYTENLSIALVAGASWVTYLFLVLRRFPFTEAVLRSLLLAIALSCLCLIIYKPQYSLSKPGGKALLLTQSTAAIPDSLQVLALPDVKTPAHVQRIPDLGFIERNYPEIQELYIAGYGLEPAQTQGLQRLQLHFLEKETPAGFNWLSYSRQVETGEALVVSGTYLNSSRDTLKLRLSSVEGLQDSVFLTSGENRFSLQAQTQIAGNYTATLQLIDGDSIRTEPLPYVVAEKQPLLVLMLQGFPSFEMNYLKDWLAQAEHQIQVRTRISRDKFATQTINANLKSGTPPLLSEENLQESDLLICDTESFRLLSATEKKRLQQAIEQGLGILVLADEAWLRNPQLLGHKFTHAPSRLLSFTPRQKAQAAHGSVMADKLPAAFTENPMLVPVAYSEEEEITTAYIPDGKGRIGAMLATATFPLILQGEAALYSRLWTDILQKVSRRHPANEIRLNEFSFILKDHPATFSVTDTLLTPATILYTSGTKQQAMPQGGLPKTVEKNYHFLPAEEGWIQIHYGKDTTLKHHAYVLPAHVWTDLKQAVWWRQNQKNTLVLQADKVSRYNAWQHIPPVWLFLPLVASLATLWWREKG